MITRAQEKLSKRVFSVVGELRIVRAILKLPAKRALIDCLSGRTVPAPTVSPRRGGVPSAEIVVVTAIQGVARWRLLNGL